MEVDVVFVVEVVQANSAHVEELVSIVEEMVWDSPELR